MEDRQFQFSFNSEDYLEEEKHSSVYMYWGGWTQHNMKGCFIDCKKAFGKTSMSTWLNTGK